MCSSEGLFETTSNKVIKVVICECSLDLLMRATYMIIQISLLRRQLKPTTRAARVTAGAETSRSREPLTPIKV